jgi:beta-lactamase superfamily II metal-dependent hydrolase
MAPPVDYVSVDSAPMFDSADSSKPRMHLLWGDRVEIVEQATTRARVRSRGRRNFGWVERTALGGDPLLELYFIDVGQGDGILLKTPAGRHVMIDGGWRRRRQDTGKSAADFVDWKFFQDYGEDRVVLDAMIASHCDADHYGGLWDLLDVAQTAELDCTDVRVKAMYHAGIGWWKKPGGGRTLGPWKAQDGSKFFTRLMGDRPAVAAALAPQADPALQGEWADFMRTVLGARWTNNHPTPIARLRAADGHLPGFGPGAAGEPAIRVLAPVEFNVDGAAAIRRFTADESQNTNGNSLLLRVDFGRARILLTGDLNRRSQGALLDDYTGSRQEFLCDVAKACHHGSDDVSVSFLQAMNPAVTVFSSGDNEGHDHPRAEIVAASAVTGHLEVSDDNLVSPLVYSTELARSVRLGRPVSLDYESDTGVGTSLSGARFNRASLHYTDTRPGSVAASRSGPLGRTQVVAGLIYGLVNVRTDGDRILCATLDEADRAWRIQSVRSRF